MRAVISAIFVLLLAVGGASAQNISPVPDRRVALTEDLDFYGADLQNIFDTTLEACVRICLANPECQAFTFNTNSNACFPKGDLAEVVPYDGAYSGRVYVTDAGVLAGVPARRAQLDFLSDYDVSQARDLALRMSRLHVSGEWTAQAHKEAAENARSAGNTLDALAFTGAAINLNDAPDLWVEYARLSREAAGTDSNNAHTHRNRALAASVGAFLRTDRRGIQVNALVQMAAVLESQNRGRDMISALRLAESIQPRQDVLELLDEAIGKYGFRITEHTVDNNAAEPRVCATFSEPLMQAGVDYTPYVQVPEAGFSIEADGAQICVSGVEHGKRYTVTFREGLPAESGEKLIRSVPISIYVRDRDPSVRFSGRSYVLPRGGNAALPIDSVNLNQVDLTLFRVSDRNMIGAMQNDFFARPLDYWQEDTFEDSIAQQVWIGTGELQNELNRDMTTQLPMGDVIADMPAGIYALRAAVRGADTYDSPAAMQWFVLTDLGVTTMAGADGLHVFVRGLADAEPLGGVTVELISRANAVLGTATTDAQGYAQFSAALTNGRGAAEPAMITAANGDDDMVFLSLTNPGFDLSDRGVEGREPAGAMDAFLTTDRGAYRAGETVFVTTLLRDGQAEAIEHLPLTAILTRPDGVEFSRETSVNGVAGGHVYDLPIPESAPRGSWTLAVYADTEAPALARARFLVEDFLPERIDFDMTLQDGPLTVTDTPDLTIDARYLFGAPGADLKVDGEVLVRPANALPNHPRYRFGRHDQPIDSLLEYLSFPDRTDANGQLATQVVFPEFTQTLDRPMEARFAVRVMEGSGRPVERDLIVPINPDGPMIGIKPNFDWSVPEYSEASFDLMALDAAGQPADMQVRWTINRVRTRYSWYSLYGEWNWEPHTTRERVATGEARLGDMPITVAAPVEWGRYEIRVERVGGPYVSASTGFSAGWYAPASAVDTPDMLEVSLDAEAYDVGDTATLRMVPRHSGKAIVTVMSNRLIHMQAVDVTEGENVIELPVTEEWGAGAYVTASVIRPMNTEAGHNPARALGLTHAAIDPGAHQLDVALEVPDEAPPRGPLDVALNVDGVLPGETAYASIAVVDQGILNLTGFEAPDPNDHFFGQRKLGMEIRDLYGRLIDASQGAPGMVRSGGDAGRGATLDAPPPTEDLVAYFEGPVMVAADGTARVTFDLPSFNGTAKVMAVVWSRTGVGQADADVLIRDPVVVTASLPRFMAPGDSSRLLLEVVHATGPSGRMGLDVSSDTVTVGDAPSGFKLGDLEKTTFTVPISTNAVGVHEIDIALTTPDGQQLLKSVTLPVQMNDPLIAETTRFDLSDGSEFLLSSDVFAGLVPGTGSVTLSSGPIARFDAPGLLQALDRYPYGCTEQVASQTMPLLYLSQVAEAMNLGTGDQISERVDQAITRVLSNQSSGGSFGLWYPTSGDMWLDAYVTDFLSRARTQGYAVPDHAFRNALDNLRNQVNYAPDFDSGGQEIAYALYILAREGAAAAGDLRYYADVKPDAFDTPMALAHLGAALASYGDPSRADAMFGRAARMMAKTEEGLPVWRADYGTNRRDAAAVLTLALEAGSNVIDPDVYAAAVAPPNGTDRRSTQEAVWTLMATNMLLERGFMSGFKVNDQQVTGPMVQVLEDDASVQPVQITNGTGRNQVITMTTLGIPSDPVPAGGDGYAISRIYYDMDGTEVDPTRMLQGERYVTVLTVTPYGDREARLMVNDPLPAGLEIDNPNLLQAGDVSALDWLQLDSFAQHTEFRQERFLAAVDWYSDSPFRLAYIVRAVSPGEFLHPAASVEDMYRPQFRARTYSGRVTIVQ